MRIILYIKTIIYRIKLLIHFIINYQKYINKPTYYPEKDLKTTKEVLLDFIYHILKCGEIDESYFDLGLDIKGRSYNDCLSYNQYMMRRNRLNLTKPFSYVCILRNKSLFSTLGKCWGFPVVQDLAKMQDGQIIESQYPDIISLLKANNHIFIKPIDSKKGQEVHEIDYINNQILVNNEIYGEEAFKSFMVNLSSKFELLIQTKIMQHSDVSKIYRKSVNTLRIVTINNTHSSKAEDIYLLGVELRLGANGNVTDNISAGGIKIGVDLEGKLCKYGFYNHKYGTKTTFHPDTNIQFEGYQLPFYKDSVKLCKEFHAKLKEIHLIGWDVALTDNGPVFIEGNDDCGTDFQVLFGPMKHIYDKYLPQL